VEKTIQREEDKDIAYNTKSKLGFSTIPQTPSADYPMIKAAHQIEVGHQE